MAYLTRQEDYNNVLLIIYYFVDNFIKGIIENISYALEKPNQNTPPMKKHKLSVTHLVTLGIFRFFKNVTNWKAFYIDIKSSYSKDFPNLPKYKNFLTSINKLSWFAVLLLEYFMQTFKKFTEFKDLKFTDSTKLEVCKIKREFNHKVCKNIASKSKSSMGWFYGFKLHIICNNLMQILSYRITTGATDDREGLEMIWNDIFGIIVADAGYLGKNRQQKAQSLGKTLLTAVKANMKKLITKTQHEILKLRQCVETVFSVLKHRMNMETSLPRSALGHFAHYLWCLVAYQLDKFLDFTFNKPFLA